MKQGSKEIRKDVGVEMQGAGRAAVGLLLIGFGRLIGSRGAFQGLKGRLRLPEDVTASVFPSAEQKERQSCGQGPKFRPARNLGFRFPTKELRGHEKSEDGPAREREDLNQELPDWERLIQSALQSGDQVSGR